MKRKINLFTMMLAVLITMAVSSKSTAQSVFWSEDFSTGTQYSVTLGAEGNDGLSDYFHRTDGTNIDKVYVMASGYFFAGQDIDDSGWSGSGSPSQLTWSGIDISGKTNLQFSGMFGEALDGTGDIDNDDYLYLEYRIDNGTWDTLIAFRNDGTQYNTNFMEDTDLDGIGDGMLITNDTLNNFTKSIGATGSLLDLRFTAAVTSGDEDFAIDEFELSGVVANPVSYLWNEDFDNNLNGIDTVSVLGPQVWVQDVYSGTTYAKMSGYSGSAVANEDWLMSPSMDLTNYTSVHMVFNEAINYENGVINDNEEVYISTDYTGDPTTANWTELTVTNRASGGSWTFVEVDTLDLSAYVGNSNVTVAFKYTSSASNAGTWEIDYAHIFGVASMPTPSVSFSASAFTGLNYVEGNGPSDEDTLTISASNIQDSLVFASSTNFELSLDAATYMDTLIVDDTLGSITNLDIYIRLKSGLTANIYNGNINIFSTGMSAQNISLQGEVMMPPNPNILWYEDFNPDLAGIDTVSVVGAQKWYHDTYGSDANCAVMTGYDGTDLPNEDWLISPVMDFSAHSNIKMAFSEAINYESGNIADREEVYVSLDYAGDPSAATWTELTVTGRAPGDSWSFVDVDTINLSAFAGENSVTVAFKYTSDTASAGTWEIDHVNVFVDTSAVNEPSAHPTAFVAAASDSTVIDVVWSDAMNTDGYLIKMSKDGYNTIAAPVDGTEEADDTNFSDGTGVVNVTQGTEFYSFVDLDSDTEYFFMIWPYNGAAGNINYKTDGTVPQDTAITHANTSSIEDHKQLISNPYVNNQQMLTFELNIQEDMVVKLFSINGQLIRTQELNGQQTIVEIPVGDINNRIIILSVEGQNSRSIYKIAH